MFQTIASPAARTAAATIGAETGLVAAGSTQPILCSIGDLITPSAVDCQFSTCSWLWDQAEISYTRAPKGASVEQLITAVNA